ncbi:pseudouridine synthase [uncultured Mitsuokella sp.]|uniref:pseudouridine synthase n=1 Tax=uncultured Mitsuokella sp. TaxID=453120 RepID=UPI0025F21B87|nr:pseudouridine synthase [uncultured Mitsuokella sp.]
MGEERLQKIISQAGIASRRAAEKMILEGRVAVDGQCVRELGTKVNPAEHVIVVDGKVITQQEHHVYLLLNKPKGCLSTAKDDRGRRTVLDLLPEVRERVYPVGRLDNNTEGLLLITNDGELMNGLLHPRFEVEKTYHARVTGRLTQAKLAKLRQGVMLEDGMTAPAKVRELPEVEQGERSKGIFRVEITIHEGRNRQVRRMFAAVGCDVKALKRVRFAQLTLIGVPRGHHRVLTDEEINMLYRLAGLTK